MQIRQELKTILRSAAEPRQPGDMIKSLIDRAGRHVGLPYWRAYHFWYGHRDAWAHEADRIRAWRRQAEQQKQEQRLAGERAALRARVDALNVAAADFQDRARADVVRRAGSGAGGSVGGVAGRTDSSP